MRLTTTTAEKNLWRHGYLAALNHLSWLGERKQGFKLGLYEET